MELKRELGCKPFIWYLKHVYPELVIPTSEGGPGGSLKQGTACLDSMGHLLDGNVGLYPCHDTGGNQVRTSTMHLTNVTKYFLQLLSGKTNVVQTFEHLINYSF